MKRALVWFKTDLRLHDNETLTRSIAQCEEVIPVYCFDEAQFGDSVFGFQKTGAFRAQFLLESVANLDQNLRALGSGLVVVCGHPETEIVALAQQFGVQKVFAKKEVAYEECKTQEQVEKALWGIRCLFETFSTSTMYHAEDLPFTLKDIPDVFTNFRKRVEKDAAIRPVFETPTHIKSPELPPIDLPSLEKWRLTQPNMDPRAVLAFKGGETAALQRLHHYLFDTQALSVYKQTRNGLIGSDYSSKFSAWLSVGCLSARQIVLEIRKYEAQFGANESTYWMIFELLWRDYFRFMVKKYKHQYFLQNGIKPQNAKTVSDNEEVLNQWVQGQTGNEFVDANMRELQLTGFMSNRGRQNVASYLCHELHFDWRYGAAYFEQQLIDYDVCSNWGNWAYLAGVGNDPRGLRVFNVDKQATEYDKDRAYRDLWLK
ncbi:MAG: cryptochrome DASH [Flavobacterium sp. BFFFF2]|nr:MAG: cryptochrome DASH [Flavobacterium sp. BFFFF2]